MNKTTKIIGSALLVCIAVPLLSYEVTLKGKNQEEIHFDGILSERRIKRMIDRLRRG